MKTQDTTASKGTTFSVRRMRFFIFCIGAALLHLCPSGALGDTYPPYWSNGTGSAIHFQPAAWPSEPADPASCGQACGDWKPYPRVQNAIGDPRTKDPSNGGTRPQNYVN